MDRKRRIIHTGAHIRSQWSSRSLPIGATFALALLLSPTVVWASAQNQTQAQEKAAAKPTSGSVNDRSDKKDDKDDTLDKAGKIASQPVRDVGITKTKIDPVLQESVKQPYAPAGNGKCSAITAELAKLNAALGPDFDSNTKANEDKAEKLALAGGEMLVNTLIPFRGLVREISGTAPAERRKASAISAGTARRGYLRGLAQTRKCKVPASPAAK